MKLRCSICKNIIDNLIIVKEYNVKDEFHLSHGTFAKVDREYLGAKCKVVIYNCMCGEGSTTDEHIKDFIRDSDSIRPDDIKESQYGTILIER